MTIERRHSLLKHDHEGDDLGPAVLVTSSMFKGLGATNALPPLGQHTASTSLSLRYATDPNYGLAAGVLGSGNAWIQAMRADGTATAYDLDLQPLGGVVGIGAGGLSLGAAPLFFGSIVSNWNEGAVDSYAAVTFKRANTGLTNQPVGYDNANMAVTFNYHGGGYARQIGFVDTQGGVYQRMQQSGTWYGWDRFAMHNGTNGYLRADGYDVWSTSGWARTISLRPGTGSAAIQFYDATRHWGVGASGGIFYFMHTTTDTSSGAGMTYPLYSDATYWNVGLPMIVVGSISIPTNYVLYMNGWAGSIFIGTANTSYSYGSVRFGGSNGGYSGAVFADAYQAGTLMGLTSGEAMGWYRQSGGVWQWYNNAGYFWTSTTLYIVPRCAWATGGSSGSAHMTRGTGAGSGGADGDIHFQYT